MAIFIAFLFTNGLYSAIIYYIISDKEKTVMKKTVISLILCILALCALCLPAGADPGHDEDGSITGRYTDRLSINATLTVESNAVVENKYIGINPNGCLIIKDGATVTTERLEVGHNCSVILEPGASLTVKETYLDSAAYLKICSGAVFTSTEEIESYGSIELEGTLGGTVCWFEPFFGTFTMNPGATVNLTFPSEIYSSSFDRSMDLNGFSGKVSGKSYYLHIHNFVDHYCASCQKYDYQCGSTISTGDIWIIVGVAAALAGAVVIFILYRKKES